MNDKSKKFIADPVTSMPDPQDDVVAYQQAAGFDAVRRQNRANTLPAEVVVLSEGSWLNSKHNPKN